MEFFILFSHAFAGFTSLVLGIALASFIKKGNRTHILLGRFYFWSMTWVFVSALIVITFIRYNLFLMMIAFFSFMMVYAGMRIFKRKKGPSVLDVLVCLSTSGAAIFAIYQSIAHWINNGFNTVVFLIFFFGIFSLQTVAKEIMIWRKKEINKTEVILYHIQSMLGSFIAAVTAFMVFTGSRWMDMGAANWVLWIMPTIVLTPMIIYWSAKFSKKPIKA